MPNTKQSHCPKDLLALGQWQNNIKETKGANNQMRWGFSTVWHFRGVGKNRHLSRQRERCSMQNALLSQRNLDSGRPGSRNGLARILDSQQNWPHCYKNQGWETLWLFAFDHEQSDLAGSTSSRLASFWKCLFRFHTELICTDFSCR